MASDLTFLGVLTVKSEYIDKDILAHVLYALTYENRLACKVAIETGLRIGDVLALKSDCVRKRSFTITEQKTKKRRTIKLTEPLRKELSEISGKVYVFEHRFDENKHRTRQAVYIDIKRAAKLFRIKESISPHSIRKIYAVDELRRTGDLERVKKLLNHDSIEVTMLYAMADIISKRRPKKRA